jgi:hypothetical protein
LGPALLLHPPRDENARHGNGEHQQHPVLKRDEAQKRILPENQSRTDVTPKAYEKAISV